jgi:glycosyltransferase involved in cell wall biosynthesis
VADRIVAAGFPTDRVRVIENAVQPPAPHDRREARTRLGLPPESPVAVCLARLVDQKRHDLLLEAWRDQAPDAVLLLAGDGPNRARIEAQVADLGLGGRVRVLGARTDVDWLLAAADVSVLATDWEGLPISVLEAMAAGVPVVASAVGGLADTLPGAACLVAPGSADALAAGLAGLLADAGARTTFGAAGAALVADRFGVERMRAGYLAEYGALLA